MVIRVPKLAKLISDLNRVDWPLTANLFLQV